MDRTFPATNLNPATAGRAVALLTLCLAVLVAQVDTAVVNLAVHPIGVALGARVPALQWLVDSYNLTYATLLLTGGLLADLAGRRLVFMAGAGIFTLASITCALSSTINLLIAGRVVAGLGAALIIPSSLAIVRVIWPDPSERHQALGIWAACNGLAMAIGPTLGGLLIHSFNWRSVFLLVVPFSVAALGLASVAIPESAHPEGRHFDLPAQALGALALGAIAFGAIEASDAPYLALVALTVMVIAGGAFLQVEARHGPSALVPLDLFRLSAFRRAMVATSGMTFAMYGVLFLLPLTWQGTEHFDAVTAGLALMPMALVFLVVSPFSGALTRHFGPAGTAGGGLLIIACGLLFIGEGAGRLSLVMAEAGLAATGLGMGLATGPLMGIAVGAVAAARAGTASALINVARMIGATIGVAVLGAVYAMEHVGAPGLRNAMFLGALVLLVSGPQVWRTKDRPQSP